MRREVEKQSRDKGDRRNLIIGIINHRINIFWGLLVMSSICYSDFSDGKYGKESGCNEGDPGLTPGLGRTSGEGNGSPLQYSCLENSMD